MRTLLRAFALISMMQTIPVLAAHELDGVWSFNVQVTAGSGVATMTIAVGADNTISGTYAGQVGEAPIKGKVDGDKVELSFDSELAGTVTYSGTLANGRIEGTCVYGDLGTGTFEATRNDA